MAEEKKKENGRVIKFFIVPTLLISFLLAFSVAELRVAGILYVVMDLYALFIFSQPRYKEEIFGISSNILAPLVIGVGTGIGFLILTIISPIFSLLTPTIPFTVSEDVRFFIIVIIAPLAEESWRSATIGLIREIYRTKINIAIVISAILFAALHLGVYGIGFGALQTWLGLYGQFTAIVGFLFVALLFGLLAGYMNKTFNTILPATIAHIIINFWLVTKGLVIIS